MSENEVSTTEEQSPLVVEPVDMTVLKFDKPGRKEAAYKADQVDSALDYIESQVVARDTLIAQLQNQLLNERVPTEVTERVGLLEAANAQLRQHLQEALEAQDDSPSEAAQATELLQRASEIAEEHISNAQAEAEKIVQDARDSLTQLASETDELYARRASLRATLLSAADELQ